MNDTSFPKWFWVVAVLALLWNLMGLVAFVMEVTRSPESLAQMTEAQQNLVANMPSWVVIAFGVAVVAGVLGSVGLLMRKTWAFPIFVISLLAVIVQQIYMHFLSNTFEAMGEGSMIMPSLVLLIAFSLALFSHRSSMKGWLQ